jgi:hypothetical protein
MKGRILFSIFLIFAVAWNLNAFFSFNETCIAFPNQCADGKNANLNRVVQTDTIGSLVVQSAVSFLEAGKFLHSLLKTVESSGNRIDNESIIKNLDSTIGAMENAYKLYYRLKWLADETPYNRAVLKRLSQFNYDDFQEKNGLIPSIFGNVKGYLSVGDVRGMYSEFLTRCGKLLEALRSLKADIDGGFLNIPGLWKVNQMYVKLKMFGQYAAMVFSSVR